MIVFSKCFDCIHFHDDNTFTCKAFPDGIPNVILTVEHDHVNPYPGDNGIQFEAKPGSKPPELPPTPTV